MSAVVHDAHRMLAAALLDPAVGPRDVGLAAGIAQALADAEARGYEEAQSGWVYCPDCGTWLDYPQHRDDCPYRDDDDGCPDDPDGLHHSGCGCDGVDPLNPND